MSTVIERTKAYVGAAHNRVDGLRKAQGQATYSAEYPLEGLTYGVLVDATIASGVVRAIEGSAARAVRGVIGILTHENAPRLQPIEAPPAGERLMPFQDAQVHYHGQHLALVIADTLEAATYAASLVSVTYDESAVIARLDDHLDAQYDPGSMFGEACDETIGDPVEALRTADVTIDRRYTTSLQHHNPMEPSSTTAHWDGERLIVYDATQWISGVQILIAQQLEIPKENIRVVSEFLGGGFGCKGWVWPHVIITVMAAKVFDRPVKTTLSRRQMYTSHGYRSGSFQRVQLGARRDGTLRAIMHEGIVQTSVFDDRPDMVTVATRSHYRCPNMTTTNHVVKVNQITPTPMRAPNENAGNFGLECALDELAEALDLDPIELRLRNYAERHPTSGLAFSSKRLRACYDLGAEKFGWDRRGRRPRSVTEGHLRIGTGFASVVNFSMVQPATVRAVVFADGSARIESGSQDIGTGTYTILTQIAADELGIDPARIEVRIGDTNLPPAGGSFGSSTVASVGSAVRVTCRNLRAKIAERAARGASLAGAVAASGESSIELTSAYEPDELDAETKSFGAVFAEVSVDEELGTIRARRIVGAYDAGCVINPKTARSQLIGGIIWGIGMALHERTEVDPRTGRYTNANIAEYLIPVHADIGEIEANFVESEDYAFNPVGAKGIGELPVIGVAAAISNAVYNAVGVRLRELPLRFHEPL